MIFKDYYKILGINNYKAGVDEIKQSYREQAKKYHPDMNSENKGNEERFKDINEAYKTLSDPIARKKYDRMWYNHIGKRQKSKYEEKRTAKSVFKDLISMFFGEKEETYTKNQKENRKNKKAPVKGENIDTEVSVSIEEAFYGKEKKISLRTTEGKMKTFTVKIPAGIRNYEKIRLVGQGKQGANGRKSRRLIN